MDFSDFVLAGTTRDLAQERKVREIADALEFRIDLADDPINDVLQYDGELPIIASSPTRDDKAADENLVDSLLTALDTPAVEAVDIELDRPHHKEDLKDGLDEFEGDIIVSYYNYEYTPDKETLIDIAKEAVSAGDIAKIAVMAQSPDDALTLLSVIDECSEQAIPICGFSLGEIGSYTRIIAPLYGSRIGYAPVDLTEEIPYSGQFNLKELKELIENAKYENSEIKLHEKLADKPEFQNM